MTHFPLNQMEGSTWRRVTAIEVVGIGITTRETEGMHMTKAKYTFEPDYTISPGVTLKETLDAIGMSQTDLCLRTGLAEKTISQIINGVAPITLDTAEQI